MSKHLHILVIFAISIVVATSVEASSSTQERSNRFSDGQLITFAKRVEHILAKKGVRVFIIGRLGQPAKGLPDGINYTHTALGVYSAIKTEDGTTAPGYVLHNLYQKSDHPNISYLTTDFPIDYFSSVEHLQAGILVPTPALQYRLLQVIESDTYKLLHQPKYSAIANPFTLELQNCTEHTLDIINAAIYQTADIQQIKANTQAYFKPQLVKVSGFKLFLGSIFKSDIATRDHPGPIVTATFTTIGNYLETFGLLQERLEIVPVD